MAKKIKLEVEDVKIETSFDDVCGAEAEITGTYHGKPFLAYVQGGRDEEGNFERNNCPDCWTSIHVGEKHADFIGAISDNGLAEILGFNEDQEEEVWDAVEEFLTEHLGEERFWYGPNDPLDHFEEPDEIEYEELWLNPREELNITEAKIEFEFADDLGPAARITGKYKNKDIMIYVQGGRDEKGNFERSDCPDCWITVDVNGKAVIDAEDNKHGISKLSKILDYKETTFGGEAWGAVRRYLDKHLGMVRHWEYGDKFDRYKKDSTQHMVKDKEPLIRGYER